MREQVNKGWKQTVYAELDQDRALVLYAMLKLQDHPEGATQESLVLAAGLDKTRIWRMLKDLRLGGYVIPCRIHAAEARLVYEVSAITTTTYRDTAVILLELLKFKADSEGKVYVDRFVNHLLTSKKLRDFKRVDLLGDGTRKGKLAMLAEQSGHIEWVTPRFIKPRLKTRLQVSYLKLVAEQPSIEEARRIVHRSAKK